MATGTAISELRGSWYPSNHAPGGHGRGPQPRIALLTPYSGNNLGDAAIQDSMIVNLRLRLPGARFSGITLNCGNFVERHGIDAFPMCGTNRPFYGMSRGGVADQRREGEHLAARLNHRSLSTAQISRALKSVPILGQCLKKARAWVATISQESCHFIRGYRFLRRHDLVIVSGGGQLDDEWGGPWGLPFTLFKWAVLARIARVPYAIASVGAGKAASATSRFFLSVALRMARYRSYRDKNSREFAAGLLQRAAGDSVVPDPAFSLPTAELPPPAGIRAIAHGRTIVAISPMAYAKPGSWPHKNPNLYDRYLHEMASIISQLLKRDYFLVIVWSALSDENILPELLEHLDPESKRRQVQQLHIPMISTWQNLVAFLQDVNFLIASRLHSAILGFVAQTPTIAISFDPKVDWVMENLGQMDYLLQLGDFTAEDVIKALDRLALRRSSATEEIGLYRCQVLAAHARQFDALVDLAVAGRRRRN